MASALAYLLTGLAVLVAGNVLNMVGMFTPAWTTLSATDFNPGFEVGPIKTCAQLSHALGGGEHCVNTQDELDSDDDSTLATELRAVAAMLILGMIAGLASAAVVALVLVLHRLDKDRPAILNFATLAISVASFLFIIIGVVVWAAKVHDDFKTDRTIKLDWSFALSIVGGGIILIGGAIATMGALRGTQCLECLRG